MRTSLKKSKKRQAKTFVATGVYNRLSGLVSWPVGGAYAPIGGAYPSTGGVYPFIGSGSVVCWCISEAGRVFHAVESLSGSWSAQVPERPTAVGSRLEYPRGCRGVDLCGPSRRFPELRRFGRFVAPLQPFAWFQDAGGSAADRTTVETSLTLRPFAWSVAHLSVYACFRDHPQNLAFRCGRP